MDACAALRQRSLDPRWKKSQRTLPLVEVSSPTLSKLCGTAMGFGYRGSPCRIDLGFDATADFHSYAIDWRPDRVAWLVDGRVVHERVGWDPTPIPHLSMRVHANLWAPRSDELAGHIDEGTLPAAASSETFRPGRQC